ncbi:MAG: YlxR family protein [Mycoplasmataceae bacterium]|nr:YlxR family protein [Mycoplasmataceae bacterium]
MKKKYTNQILNDRTCIVTRKKYPKEKLLRIAKVNNEYFVDINQNMGGRGLYVLKEDRIISICISKQILMKKLKLSSEEYIKIENELKKII